MSTDTRSTVSVVVPTYNRADRLKDTIASILAQTVQPLEVLIVDDGSTDDTARVCREFPSPVRYIHRENGGSAAARNTGMRAAKGEYIAFLDADDVWEPAKLEIQLALHAAHPEIGWSATNHFTTDRANQPLPGVQGFARDLPAFEAAGLGPDAFFALAMTRSEITAAGSRHVAYTGDAFELSFYGNFVYPSCAMLHRSVLDRAGLFDESLRCAVDTEYFHRVGAHAPIGIVMTPLFRWRRGPGETIVSSANMEQLVRNALLSVDRAAQLRALSPRARTLYVESRRRLLLRLAYVELSNLNRAAARHTIRRAWAEGAQVTPRGLGIYGASLLPGAALRGLHQLKRRLGR
ncbi:MAG TPA: glycosyltransferase [Gemmatimonadales bacterium]